jgi:hypothetical protein
MRHKLFLSIFLLAYQLNYCQGLTESPAYYITSNTKPIGLRQCSIQGVQISSDNIIAPFNSQFYKLGEWKDSIVITFLYYSDQKSFEKYNALLETVTTKNSKGEYSLQPDERKYFLLSKYSFENNCTPVYSRKLKRNLQFTSAAVSLPVKLRLKDFDFDKNFSLGLAGGIKNRISKYSSNYINILVALNISTNDLDSFSTRGKLTGQPIKNIATFSPALGFVFEFGKAQVGIFYGVDLMSKSNRNKFDWIYHNKPWLSIGFGFSILGKEGSSNNTPKSDNGQQSSSPTK